MLCHDGITLKAWFNADISLADDEKDKSIEEKVEYAGEPYSCALADKLDKEHSHARINIIGSERRVPDRESFTPVLVKGAVNDIDEAKAVEAAETVAAAVAVAGAAATKTAGVVKQGR